jgi:ABC-type transport system involved in multi-copper enzyme maturation permease subunit
MYGNIITIAKNTFKETARDRVLLSVFFVVIAIILFSLFIASISLDQSSRMVLDFGITAIYMLQIFVAIFIGSMLIYKEIERKTFYLLLPKPVTRTEVVIGKCLGLTTTVVAVTLLSAVALFTILLIQGDTLYIIPVLLSLFLSTLESAILILVSILFSSITSPILAAVSTFAVFLVGHAGEIFRYIFMMTKVPIIAWIAKGVYYLLPNLEKFNIRNDIVYGTLPTKPVVIMAILYAFAYATLLIAITHTTLRKKDF